MGMKIKTILSPLKTIKCASEEDKHVIYSCNEENQITVGTFEHLYCDKGM